jgi:hypothetical protein
VNGDAVADGEDAVDAIGDAVDAFGGGANGSAIGDAEEVHVVQDMDEEPDMVFVPDPNADGLVSSDEDEDTQVELGDDEVADSEEDMTVTEVRPAVRAPTNYLCSWLMCPFDSFAYTRPAIANGDCAIDALQTPGVSYCCDWL